MANTIDYLKEQKVFDTLSMQEALNEIVQDYLGSCDELADSDHDWLDENGLFGAIDDIMFRCESCGWWCEISEQANQEKYLEQVCSDCFEE